MEHLKALTGQNINQYIRTVKVVKAASLIKDEKIGVAQAAFEVGFSSTTHFRKLFKEQFGFYLQRLIKKATFKKVCF
ncbi:helix-turn-helix domain-containing protein [Algoriphagus persicinus]|uniref:helix-turn-helix domain-containing protein n=1 Tax=Algoriphagus persicinus TaxID=3108754 RepID=UPI002B3A6887|nr:helix-turn-helix domain-containing protein [Algoriphagus sp. E1-3-M2]MEB2784000.1 helix-turn-helix domain-containing protein [Algoriphagus sp. E1-3-M2]